MPIREIVTHCQMNTNIVTHLILGKLKCLVVGLEPTLLYLALTKITCHGDIIRHPHRPRLLILEVYANSTTQGKLPC